MKLLIKYSVLALIVLALGILIFLLTLDINQYKPLLVATVSELTGRELRIEGDLELTPSLTPVISSDGITLANAPWSSSGVNMLSVGRVEAKVSLLPLLSGKIHIDQFILHDTRISLETNAEGAGNWILDTTTTEPITASDGNTITSTLPSTTIEAIDIRNANIAYIDGTTGTISRFEIKQLSTGINELNAPMAFTAEAAYGAFPIKLNGNLGSINALLADTSYPLDINGRISIFNIRATGKVEKPLSFEGVDINFNADVNSLSDLNTLAQTELPSISPVAVSGNLKFSDPGRIDIDAFKFQLGNNNLSGRINYESTSPLPFVTMQLQSELVDVTPFSGPENEQKPEYLFPKDALPFEVLSLLGLDVSLAVKQFRTAKTNFNNFQGTLKVDNGTMLASLASDLAGGSFAGAVNLQTRKGLPPSFNIDFTGNGILLEQLPHDDQKPWFAGGPVDLKLKGAGQGNNAAEFVGSFNGSLLVKVGEATMPNSDVDLFGADILMSIFNKLNPLSKSEKTALLECAVINLNIRDGIAKVDRQIAMQTSKMSMVGSGEINFKSERLNLGIKPYARKGIGLNLGSITGIAKIGGTLANPKAEIDAEGALKMGVTAGAAIATGGLSLLAQGLFNKTTDDSKPCNTALQTVGTNQPVSEPVIEASPAENKDGLLDTVKNKFKNLFGN